MPRTLSRSEIASLEESLTLLLRTVKSGDLDASTAMTYRMEGAVAALKVVLGASAAQLLEQLASVG